MTSAHATRTAGFTLLELLTVIAIIGILAAIGITSYLRWAQRARADAAVAEVQRIVTQATARVRTTNRDVTVTLDPAAHTLTLTQGSGYTATYPVDASSLGLCRRTPTATTDTCTPTPTLVFGAPHGTLPTDALVTIRSGDITRDAYLLGPTALLKVIAP